MSEKQFDATPSRIEKAKREGDIARSQEFAGVAAFAAGLIGVASIVEPLAASARAALSAAAAGTVDANALAIAGACMAVPAGCAAAGSTAANLLQSGGLRFTPVTIKADRLNPGENLKRIFSREALVTAARAAVAFLCAGAAIVPAFGTVLAAALHAGGAGSIALAAWNGALRSAAIACAVGGVFSAADYALQLARWRKRLRMSHDELKRDHKESDGDPQARSRRRSMHRQIARGSLRRVKDAAFVVTNPTHLAIALEYRPPQVPVPRVLVRAADDLAARVRELATVHGVPLIENVPLARQLYADAKAGEFIPHASYVAVAEIVAALTRPEASA